MRAVLKPAGHSRRGTGASRSCADRSGQRRPEAGLEAGDGVGEDHGTIVIPAQLLCGAGYEVVVIAFTTSDEMNA